MENEEIKLPEFNEKEFIEAEKRKAKTSFIVFLFGIFMAIICHLLWRNLNESIRWPLCFLFALASIGFMGKILQIFKIDVSKFSKKEWFASISFYFFTWLAIFILSINPPFYDASPPKIDVVLLPEIQQKNQELLIVAYITDNFGIRKVSIKIGENEYGMEKDEHNVYSYRYKGIGNEKYEIIAEDKKGNKGIYSGNLKFSDKLIKVNFPNKLNSSDEIEIRVLKNISKENFRVYYIINGHEINATKNGETEDYFIYITSPRYVGWKKNEKNEIEIFVEVIHYFPGIQKKYNNTIYGGNYSIETTSDEKIGTEKSPVIFDLPKYQSRRTPGFEIIILLVALLILLRKRK